MKQNIKIPLLRAMGQIFERSAGCQLQDSIWDDLQEDLKFTAGYFGVSAVQAFFVAHIFVHNYNHSSGSINRIIRHLNCNPMRLLEYSTELDALVKRGIIRKSGSRRREVKNLSNEEFFLSPKVEEAILQDRPMPDPESPLMNCFVELLEKVVEMADEVSDNAMGEELFMESLEILLNSNTHFAIISEIQKRKISPLDAYVFLKLVWEILNGFHGMEVENAIRDVMVKKAGRRVRYLQEFLRETHVLITLDWVRLKQSRFLNEAEIELAETGRRMLVDSGLYLEQKKEKNKNFIDSASIATKELFFNQREAKELAMLQSMMMESNFKRLQSRLKKKSLPRGLTVLFFGQPGTGKTESVLQMARKSGREIYKVDISQTKSMWFGESEKIIKKIFTDYRAYAKDSKRMPILLFNEADAVIAKRKDSASSTVAQTENAIQNIILEELENFEGIFMATTNLMENMDKAFDRRFLFKIKFDNPSPQVKTRIWMSKLSFLKEKQCAELSAAFDFTGGQIDNIVRKCETQYVLSGKMPCTDQILEFCRAEMLHPTALPAIGFRKAGNGT